MNNCKTLHPGIHSVAATLALSNKFFPDVTALPQQDNAPHHTAKTTTSVTPQGTHWRAHCTDLASKLPRSQTNQEPAGCVRTS